MFKNINGTIFFALAAILTSYGCSDDNNDPAPDSCDPANFQPVCVGNTDVRRCINRAIVSFPCEGGWICSSGTCVNPDRPAAECDAARPCADKKICIGGKCVAQEIPAAECSGDIPCPDGKICSNGKCTTSEPPEKCNKNARRCNADGLSIEICDDGGNWSDAKIECPGGCVNGNCLQVEKCVNDEEKCTSEGMKKCRDGEWILDRTCPYGCKIGANTTTCLDRPDPSHTGILSCEFSSLADDPNLKELKADARVAVADGFDATQLTGALVCGHATSPTFTWRFVSEKARFLSECDACGDGEIGLTAEIDYSAVTAGNYDCVFKVQIGKMASTSYYLCPTSLGTPIEESIPNADYLRQFSVAGSEISGTVLAHWAFSQYAKTDPITKITTAVPDDGALMGRATLTLSDNSEMSIFSGTGGMADGAAALLFMTNTPDIDYENAKHYVFTASSKGYKNIRFQYKIAGSGTRTKAVATAAQIQNVYVPVGTPMTFNDKNIFHDFPETAVAGADNLDSFKLLVVPFYPDDDWNNNDTLRIDDIFIVGDPI